MSKETTEITADSMFDPSRRRFLGLLAGGLVGVVLAGSGWILYRRLNTDKNEIMLVDNLQNGKVNSQNIIVMSASQIQTILDSTNNMNEQRLTLPFPFNPSNTASTIEFVRDYREQLVQPRANYNPANYVRFGGIRKGTVFNAPFSGEFAWSDAGNGAGVFLQQRVSEGRFVTLIVSSKEQIEILVNVPPVPQNTPIFFSESKTHVQRVSISQPMFRVLTENNLSGSNNQIDILGSLFTLTGPEEEISPLGSSGYNDVLDMHFLLTAENKYIVTK